MSSQPIRIGTETLSALRERSAQTGEPIVRLAQRYIDEGMRLDRHPGILFRDGRAGRRAVVIGGPDVWEVIAAARSAPERGEKLMIDALAERVGAPAEQIRARGHDVVSVHDPDYRRLEGAPDEDLFAAALAEDRALVTENVPDFRG